MSAGHNSSCPTSYIHPRADGVVLSVRVQPRASSTAVKGTVGDRLKVSVSGPPVDGKANAVLIKFLSKKLGVSKSAIELIRGQTSREKDLFIRGVDVAEVAAGLS